MAKIMNEIQVINQIVSGLKESDDGELETTFTKMLIRHNSKVISNVIRPGTASGGITKLIYELQRIF